MTTPIRFYVPTGLQSLFAAADLQSLANNASVAKAFTSNGTNLDLWADLLFALQYNSVTGISAGTKVADLYLMPQVDGTNYPTTAGSPAVPQKALYIGSLESRAPSTSALEYLALPGVAIPPYNFEILLANVSGQALHASASMFGKMQPYQQQAS